MKKRWLSMLIALFAVTTAFAFASCDGNGGAQDIDWTQAPQGPQGETGPQGEQGVGIKSIEKTATDGNTDTYTITYTDDTTSTFTIINGMDGKNGENGIDGEAGVDGIDGISITGAEINDKGELVLTFSEGEPINLGKIVGEKGDKGDKGDQGDQGDQGPQGEKGEKGEDGKNGTDGIDGKNGISIIGAEINDKGELVLTFSEGEPINLGKIVGEKGDKGDKGDQGLQGEKGEDGVSVEKITIENHELIIKLSNGDTINLGDIRGEKGEQGIQGPQGNQGIQGETGKSAYQLYKEKYGYAGTEEDWLDDLVNGRLATLDTYTITFNPNNGEENFTQTVEVGDKLAKPSVPTAPEGYTFDGWYVDDEKWVFIGYTVTEEMTLTAKYTLNTYTIEYTLGQGFNHADNPTTFTVQDLPLTLKDASNTEWDFEGWYTDADYTNKVTTIETLEDVRLYARWDEGTEGLAYTLENGAYAVSGYGGTESVVKIPAKYKGAPVTAIIESAFSGCTQLKKITIPNSVGKIGEGAFQGCSNLVEMSLPFAGASKVASNGYDQVFGYIFGYTTVKGAEVVSKDRVVQPALTSGTIRQYSSIKTSSAFYYSYCYDYYIPSSLKKLVITGDIISANSFKNCTMLTSVEVGENVLSIEDGAFSGCTNLVEVYNKSGLTITAGSTEHGYVGYYAKNVYTPTSGASAFSTTEDGYVLFKNEAQVYLTDYIGTETDLVLPSNITAIQTKVFRGRSDITSIVIPNGITRIEAGDFKDCTSLKKVVVPDSVTFIGENAFNGCTRLEEMRLPFVGKSKTASSDYNPYGRVFGYIFGCISNSSSNAVSGATYQYHYTPSGSSTVYYHYYIPTTLKRVTIGGGEVNGSAFYNCSMLTEVVLEDGVTGINSSAFENCSKLTNVVLSDNVTSIGDRAFLLCSGLTSIAIGNKVTNIGYNAFWSCSKLADISFNGTKEQWKAISKGNNWDNGVPATKVVCTDGEVLI